MPTPRTQPSPAHYAAPIASTPSPEAFREAVLREALADAGLTHGAEPAAIVAALRALYERALFQSLARNSRVAVYLAAEAMADELAAKLAASAAERAAESPLACPRCRAEMVVGATYDGRDADGFDAFVSTLSCDACGYSEDISDTDAAACAALLNSRDELPAGVSSRGESGRGSAVEPLSFSASLVLEGQQPSPASQPRAKTDALAQPSRAELPEVA